MRQIFQYKGRHILYNTWRVEEDEEDKKAVEQPPMASTADQTSDEADVAQARAKKNAEDANLNDDQLSVVLASMSDNRISDNVKSLVEQNT
mgnify:CR=1 FL=1